MKNVIVALCIIAPLLGQVGVANAMPANEYICKVQTTSLQTGVVKVQADDESAAKRIAAQGNAIRLDGVKEQVKTVVQCIDFPQGRFQDPKLQAFVDAMPR